MMFATRQSVFTPEKSAARLHLLQMFCKEHPYTMIVPGPDGSVRGEEDPSSQSVTRYLFLGDYGKQLLNTVISNEALEDMFLCLGRNQVEIYRPPSFIAGGNTLMAKWNNVTQMKPPRSLIDNPFECEEFKIRAFLKTVKGRDQLAFTSNAETIERWPLVQAYALEEFHMGGFLTQKHQVTNVMSNISKALAYVDAHTVDCVLAKNVEMLSFHWKNMILFLDKPKTPWRRLELSETDLVEPLESFFDFGKIQSSSSAEGETKSTDNFRGARVLLGGRTGDRSSKSVSRDNAQIGNSGVDGRPALHFTVEGDDFVSGVRVARTYLLTSIDYAILPSTDNDDDDDDDDDNVNDDEKETKDGNNDEISDDDRERRLNVEDRKYASTLMQLYGHMKRGMNSMQSKSTTTCMSSSSDCELFLSNMIGKEITNIHSKATISVKVSDFNSHGETIQERTTGRHFRYVEIVLSLENGFGSLILGDTWSVGATSRTFCLTSNIPYMRSWVCSRMEGDAVVELKRQVARSSMESLLGNMYHESELRRATLIFGDAFNTSTFLPSLPNCNVRFYHGGIYFQHNGEGAVCYMFGKDVSKIRLVESNTGGMSLLALTLSPSAPVLGAVNHYVENRQLHGEREIGMMLPHGSALLETAKDSYQRWTRSTDATNTYDDQSQGVTDSPVAAGLIECRRLSSETNGREGFGLLKTCYENALPDTWNNNCVEYVNKCLEIDVHFTFEEGNETKSENSINCINTAWAIQKTNVSSTPLIIVAGTPGSGKEQFSNVLTDRTRDEFTWKIVETSSDKDNMAMDSKTIFSSLKRISAELSLSSSSLPNRVLLVTPGAHTVADVVKMIGSNSQVASLFHVVATIGCVNVPISLRHTATAADDIQLIPGVVEQVRRGWTTHMVIFGADRSSSTPSSHAAIRNHLMEVNSDANIILAQGMILTNKNSSQNSSAPSPGGSDGSSSTLKATNVLPGCSKLSDVLISRDQLLGVATNDAYSTEPFVTGRRFQTMSTATSAVWQSVSTNLYGYLHRDRFVSALSVLTKPGASTLNIDSISTNENAAIMETPKKSKKSSFMSRLQNKAKAKVNGGVDLTKGGFDAVKMPNSTVDTETWYVESIVSFCEHPKQWFKCCSSHGHVWCTDVTDDVNNSSKNVEGMNFLFVGPQVDTFLTSGQRTNYKKSVIEMISSCAPPLPTKKAQRTRRMLHAKEIEAVDLLHREINAGDGWYFDGRSYIGPTGDTQRHHPKLEIFLKEYLTEQNESIEIYNNYVQARRIRSELARKGETYEDEKDVILYAEEEAQRISGQIAIVSVGSASAVSSPSNVKRNVAYETKEDRSISSGKLAKK